MSGWFDFPQAWTQDSRDAYRVHDLRVLAIHADPAGFLLDPRVLYLGDDDPVLDELPAVPLSVDVEVADPRGGSLRAEVSLCAGESYLPNLVAPRADVDRGLIQSLPRSLLEILDRCARLDRSTPALLHDEVKDAFVPRVIEAELTPRPGDPFGRPIQPIRATFTMTARVLRELASIVPGRLRAFRGGYLYIVARVSLGSAPTRTDPEVEWAVLPIELRLDVTSPFLPEQDAEAILSAVGSPEPCDDGLPGLCVESPLSALCGNGITDQDEDCDPPTATMATTPDGFGFLFECTTDCRAREAVCNSHGACLRPMAPNSAPRLIGVQVDFGESDGPTVVPVGGEITVPATTVVNLRPLPDYGATELFQTRIEDFELPIELPDQVSDDSAAGARSRFATFLEQPCVRVYVARDRGQILVPPDDPDFDPSQCIDNFRGLDFLSVQDAIPGDSDVLLFTIADRRGGMAVADLTLVYQ